MKNRIISSMLEKGIKISKKRIWIIEEICHIKFILSVEDFWLHLRAVRPVSWATTYNTLRILSEYGIIEKVTQSNKSIAYRVVDEHKR